jgi:hypothetical protein
MGIPVTSPDVAYLLREYPHVATCASCHEYADEYLGAHPDLTVLVAVLDHHDSAHVNDRLGPASYRF